MNKKILMASAFVLSLILLSPSITLAEKEITTVSDAFDYASDMVEKYDSGEISYAKFFTKLGELNIRAWAIKDKTDEGTAPFVWGETYEIVPIRHTRFYQVGGPIPDTAVSPSGSAGLNFCNIISDDPVPIFDAINQQVDMNCAERLVKGKKVTLIYKICKDIPQNTFFTPIRYYLNYPTLCDAARKDMQAMLDELGREVSDYKANGSMTKKELYTRLDSIAQRLANELGARPPTEIQQFFGQYFSSGASIGDNVRKLSDDPLIYLSLGTSAYVKDVYVGDISAAINFQDEAAAVNEEWLSEIVEKERASADGKRDSMLMWRRSEFEGSFPLARWICTQPNPMETLREFYKFEYNDNSALYSNANPGISSSMKPVKDSVQNKDCKIAMEEKKDQKNPAVTYMFIEYDIKPPRQGAIDSITNTIGAIAPGRRLNTDKLDGKWSIRVTDNKKEVVATTFSVQGGTIQSVSGIFDKTAENSIDADVSVLYDVIYAPTVGKGTIPSTGDDTFGRFFNAVGIMLRSLFTSDLRISFSAAQKITIMLQSI